ncbi:MAG: ATP-binding protein, partial [Henriciella sp.]
EALAEALVLLAFGERHAKREQRLFQVMCGRGGAASLLFGESEGAGIPKAALATLFDAYVKSDNSAGEGLGLSVVKSLAEENGWTIHVTSSEGKGSTFAITGIALAAPAE